MGAPFALPPGRVWASRPPDQPLRHVRTMRMAEDLLPDATGIARAAALLRAGALVALPSETVYGLAADATQDSAVAAIYTAKGRPDFNPLIVHLPDLDSAMAIADFPGTASALADAFWPGPLTLVLPLKPGHGLSARVTAGHATVAIRLPAHPVMQAGCVPQPGLSLPLRQTLQARSAPPRRRMCARVWAHGSRPSLMVAQRRSVSNPPSSPPAPMAQGSYAKVPSHVRRSPPSLAR